jgi:hypothetical protein
MEENLHIGGCRLMRPHAALFPPSRKKSNINNFLILYHCAIVPGWVIIARCSLGSSFLQHFHRLSLSGLHCLDCSLPSPWQQVLH